MCPTPSPGSRVADVTALLRFLTPRMIVPAALFIAALVAFGLYWSANSRLTTRTVERDAAQGEVRQFRDVVTELTVPPDAKGERVILSTMDALAAARGLGREVATRRTNDRETTRRTRETAVRSDTADRALADTQRANVRRAARVAPVIERLQRTQAADTPEEAAQAIDDASRLPWKEWTE